MTGPRQKQEPSLTLTPKEPHAAFVQLRDTLISLQRERRCDIGAASNILALLYERWPTLLPVRLRGYQRGGAAAAIIKVISDQPGIDVSGIIASTSGVQATAKSIREMVSRMIANGDIRRDGSFLHLTINGERRLGMRE